MQPADWEVYQGKCELSENEIHVWRVNTRLVSASEPGKVLEAEELKKAYRFHFLKDQKNFIVSRGVLRTLVARYLNMKAPQVHFHYNKYGKPYLKDSSLKLQFNVSHSNGTVLLAFALNHKIGVDIEFIRPDFADIDIARHCFSSSEILTLSTLPDELKTIAFFNCWTRKEAYIKAIGTGLSIPLNSFDVSLVPGEPADLLSVHGKPEEHKRWRIIDLDAGEGYCAAAAVKGNPEKVKCLEWSEDMFERSALL